MFKELTELKSCQQQLKEFMTANGILGLVILASEGINGTISSDSYPKIIEFKKVIDKLVDYQKYILNEMTSDIKPYHKMSVQIRQETIKCNLLCRNNSSKGTLLNAQEWHQLIQQDKVIIMDVRNDYEYSLGTFKNAIKLPIKNFSEFGNSFKKFINELGIENSSNFKFAMFCTGGIRCEKSSIFSKKTGLDTYQLKGGIISYLQVYGNSPECLWEGDLYVFDNRVAIDSSGKATNYIKCFACGQPVSKSALNSLCYQPGLMCPLCCDEPNKKKFIMREQYRNFLKNKKLLN